MSPAEEPRRYDLGDGAWTVYHRTWLDRAEADALFAELLATMPWEHRPIVVFGREIPQPRLMTWAGEQAYRYSGQTLEPRPLEGTLAALVDRVAAVTGGRLDHVVLNLYRDGRDSIGMHADDERELGRNPLIASLSLGAERTFVLAPKDRRRKRETKRFPLHHGSLLLMGGTIQHTWRHALPKDPKVTEPRINLTFRRLLGPPGWRPERTTHQRNPSTEA